MKGKGDPDGEISKCDGVTLRLELESSSSSPCVKFGNLR
jgi:hypothetical protein